MKQVKLLVDDSSSWMIPFAIDITEKLKASGFNAQFISSHEEIGTGFCLFLLSCTKKLKSLDDFKHNIVIHASALPKGKGWSPLTWQILEGKNKIPLTLFEANDKIDDGDIYFKDILELKGGELIQEIRKKLSVKLEELIFKFLNDKNLKPIKQEGSETIYTRRNYKDSYLDSQKSISEQFNLLRVYDNEKYPAFFIHNSKKYILKIYEYQDV